MATTHFGEVLARILEHELEAELGETLKMHLLKTRGRSEYQARARTSGILLQFARVVDGQDFVGVALHVKTKTISFGDERDNRGTPT